MKHIRIFEASDWQTENKIKEIQNNLEFQLTKKGGFNFQHFIESICSREDYFKVDAKNAKIYGKKNSSIGLNIDDDFFEVFQDDMVWEIEQQFRKYHEYYKKAVLNLMIKHIEGNEDIYISYLEDYSEQLPDFIKNAPELIHLKRGGNSGLLNSL